MNIFVTQLFYKHFQVVGADVVKANQKARLQKPPNNILGIPWLKK